MKSDNSWDKVPQDLLDGQPPEAQGTSSVKSLKSPTHNVFDGSNVMLPGRVRTLTFPGLVAIIYYNVCGGPFGTEDVISAAGPFLALLGFLIMPLVWSAPEALVAAELATAFPSNSGYVTWVTAAFGPSLGFQEGWLSWLCGVADNAVYPVLFCDYLKHIWAPAGVGWTRSACVISFSLIFSALNYVGLSIVGWSALAMTIFTMLPFCYIVVVGMPQVEVANLLVTEPLGEIRWRKFLNVLFWNLNYWDSASTLAGEVQNPRETYPKALLVTALLVFASYILPLMVGVGMPAENKQNDWRSWHSGTLSKLGERTGGVMVKAWVVAASGVSNIGQFVSEQAANAYQLQGMAEWGWLPACFAHRSPFGTPTIGLALGLVIILALGTFDFLKIVDLLNGVYCQAQLLEFAAFLWLRHRHASLRRPYRVPLQKTASCACMLLAPMVFCLVILAIPFLEGDWEQAGYLVAAPIVGVLLNYILHFCRQRGWGNFLRDPPGCLDDVLALQTPMSTIAAPSRIGSGSQDPLLMEPLSLPPPATGHLAETKCCSWW